MKTALLQVNPVTGDIAGNIERISEAVLRAGKVDLCVTPELALSGVAPGQFLSMNDFVAGCARGLDILAARFANGPDLLVGAPVVSVYDPELLSNAAVLVSRGRWDVVSRKIRPEASRDPEAQFFDRGVSCGIINLAGWRLGLVLCESDSMESFWNVRGTGYVPLLDLISRGVDAIIHMKATPYVIGQRADMEAMLTHVAARHHIHLLSCNAVGGNGGLIFGGQSLALDPTGAVYARGRAFEEDVLVVDMATGTAPVAGVGKVWQENVFSALVLGTRDFVRKLGLRRALVSLSGGIDSALVLVVAVRALGAENVSAVIMPSGFTSEEAVAGATQLAKSLGVRVTLMPIDGIAERYWEILAPKGADFGYEDDKPARFKLNSRIRGSLLMSMAASGEHLVLNTGNKSESAMGYCTLYGDTVGTLGVIADLTKTQVYAVAEWLNEN
ncbi:MAG: NAD(+) synthase, partial [Desulfovibrionaceae bacterium]|nr:NAD(+) synthase [Desulfovibrionaceae bacterium]